jgi:hypothetical protein
MARLYAYVQAIASFITRRARQRVRLRPMFWMNLFAVRAYGHVPGDCIVRIGIGAARHYLAWSRCAIVAMDAIEL